jgi:hypothetical protein
MYLEKKTKVKMINRISGFTKTVTNLDTRRFDIVCNLHGFNLNKKRQTIGGYYV